jgi:predicted PurR-regulated permease PerM
MSPKASVKTKPTPHSKVKKIIAEKDFSGALVFPNFARGFFLSLLLMVTAAFLWLLFPFFDVLIYSVLMVVIFHPIHRWFLEKTNNRGLISAFLSTSLVLWVFLAPLILFFIFLIREAVNAYQRISEKVAALDFSGVDFSKMEEWPYIGERLAAWISESELEDFFYTNSQSWIEVLQNFVTDAGATLVNKTGNIVVFVGGEISFLAIQVFVLIFTVFFLFKDGPKTLTFIKSLSPLPPKHELELQNKLRDSIYGIVFGNFGTAVLQGFVGAIGFAILGVDNIILWGTVMTFAAFIPYVGCAIIWFPLVLVFFIQSNLFAAIFLLIWGVGVISTVDNFVRPFLIGGSTKMHPLPTFLVVIGGILLFNLKGIIFGPLILALLIAMIHIYKLEYKELLKE